MENNLSAEYRNNAGKCFMSAQDAIDSHSRLVWHRLAKAWLVLSKQVEENEAQRAILLLPLIH